MQLYTHIVQSQDELVNIVQSQDELVNIHGTCKCYSCHSSRSWSKTSADHPLDIWSNCTGE